MGNLTVAEQKVLENEVRSYFNKYAEFLDTEIHTDGGYYLFYVFDDYHGATVGIRGVKVYVDYHTLRKYCVREKFIYEVDDTFKRSRFKNISRGEVEGLFKDDNIRRTEER